MAEWVALRAEGTQHTSLIRQLLESGFFFKEVSTDRTQLMSEGGTPRASAYGLGCRFPCGQISVGASIHTLRTHLQHLYVNTVLQIPLAFCVVGEALSRLELPSTKWEAIHTRVREHDRVARQLAERLPDYQPQLKLVVVTDEQVALFPAQAELRSKLRHNPLLRSSPPYFVEQDLLFETLRVTFEASLKTGWTTRDHSAEQSRKMVRDLQEGIFPEQRCELAFDSFSLAARGPVMNYIYGPPAQTFNPKFPLSVPYSTVEPDGMIMLNSGQRLEWLIPDPTLSHHSRAVKRIVAAINSLRSICKLCDQVLPGFLPETSNDTTDALEMELAERCRQTQELRTARPNSPFSKKALECRVLRAKHAAQTRTLLIPALERLLEAFGTRPVT